MTEDEARSLIVDRFGSEAADRVGAFLAMVIAENDRQNLIAPSTVETIWNRHALDSAQLMFHVEQSWGHWLDIGTGGGFPGIVIAALLEGHVTMIEPRRKRSEFLQHCVEQLGLSNATVVTGKVEALDGQFDILSARAVASVEKLLHAADHCAKPAARWILPRGRIEAHNMDALRRDRSRVFHVEQSLTDPGSQILIIERRKGRA